MDLIDRYVYDVGRYLPNRLRADVEAELRSLLTESLEERSRAAGRSPDAALAAEVLREFGRPRDVASRYAPQPEYLIGPRLYPTYRTVVKIAIPVYAVVSLVLVVLGAFRHQGEPGSISILFRATGGFLSGTLYNLGLLTLVFALVERAIQKSESRAGKWDPARLPPVDDPDRISYFGRIFLLYCIAAVALLFNFYPDWVGIVWSAAMTCASSGSSSRHSAGTFRSSTPCGRSPSSSVWWCCETDAGARRRVGQSSGSSSSTRPSFSRSSRARPRSSTTRSSSWC